MKPHDWDDSPEDKHPEPLNLFADWESVICSDCNGSGEGRYEGSTCRSCGGSGEIMVEAEHEDADGN
jgi:RecJ-like exonuclease